MRLLDYFGEASGPCGNCDTCIEPPQTWDATDAARKALSAIYRTGQRFGVLHLIGVLRGKRSERVARWEHDRLGVFGVGADLDDNAWRGVFRQLVALGLARVDHEAHGALKLDATSRPVLKGDARVEMRRLVQRPHALPKVRAASLADLPLQAADLLQRLKVWRLAEARAQAVPAYVILHDSTLADIAYRRPRDLSALARVAGIGAKKLERYGAALLQTVKED